MTGILLRKSSKRYLSFYFSLTLPFSHRIWDWQNHKRLNQFSNGNPVGSKINEIRYINEDDQALLLTGSSDGVLKLFRHYESAKNIEIVTAFRALPELIPSTRNAGLVLDWQQGQGKALVAGDVKVIRVWNAATEVCTNVSHGCSSYQASEEPANLGSSITGYPRALRVLHHIFDI
jgi:WD40 repeat protein